jgi:hypothetical protein
MAVGLLKWSRTSSRTGGSKMKPHYFSFRYVSELIIFKDPPVCRTEILASILRPAANDPNSATMRPSGVVGRPGTHLNNRVRAPLVYPEFRRGARHN